MSTPSTDTGLALYPVYDRIGRLEGDHRVMEVKQRGMMQQLGRVSGDVKEIGRALDTERKARIKADAAIRSQIAQAQWWMLVAAAGLIVGMVNGDAMPFLGLIKAKLGL